VCCDNESNPSFLRNSIERQIEIFQERLHDLRQCRQQRRRVC
jgi:hypothetical protein